MKILPLIIIMLYAGILFSYPQISITGSFDKKNRYVYDSLCNVVEKEYDNRPGYLYLKGQELLLVDMEPYGFPSRFKCIDNGSVENVPEKSLYGKYFHIDGVIDKQNKYVRDPFILIRKDTNDTLIYTGSVDDNKKWIVTAYYEKIKSIYAGETLVFIKDSSHADTLAGLINMETDKRNKYIQENSLWKCTDVSVKLRKRNDDSMINDYRCGIILVLENPEYGKHYCYYENSAGEVYRNRHYSWEKEKRDLILGKFMFRHDYDQYLKLKEKNKAGENRNLAIRKALMIKKYGAAYGRQIAEGKINTGMTKQMCIDSWGEPERIHATDNRYGTNEEWVYGDSFIQFKNGKISYILK